MPDSLTLTSSAKEPSAERCPKGVALHIAYHESGHAVVAAALGETEGLQKVSVVSRGRGIGHLAVLVEDKLLPTRHDMESQVAIAMAGIAAEEMIFGQPSIGAEADLEVRRILDEQEAVARAILAVNQPMLDSLAETLMVQETIQGEELMTALRGATLPPVSPPVAAGNGNPEA